jgi:hypothetical protein
MSLRPFRLIWLATAALLLAPSVASAGWTVPPTPNAGPNSNILQGVDCTSADSCIAVGVGEGPLVERWDGASWQILPSPMGGVLHDVACPWPQFCFAVGEGGSGPLVEVWNGTRWSAQSTPAVPGAALYAVSCSAIVACTAVGRGPNGTPGATEALAMRWEGAGWHVQPTPNPPGDDQLNGVSCPLKRTCTAVGGSTTGSGTSTTVKSPFITRWYGRVNTWGLQSAPKPEGAEDASLEGVSCPVAPICVAVGSSNTHLGNPTGLTERRIGADWSVLTNPPLPPNRFSALYAVGCPTLASCRAVEPNEAWRFDGTSWQIESIPYAPLPNLSLGDISCPSRFFCMAVGAYGISHFSGAASAKWTP